MRNFQESYTKSVKIDQNSELFLTKIKILKKELDGFC